MLACDNYGTKLRHNRKEHANRRAVFESHACNAVQSDGQGTSQGELTKRSIYVPELGKSVLVDISVAGMRHVKKNGAYKTLKKAKVI